MSNPVVGTNGSGEAIRAQDFGYNTPPDNDPVNHPPHYKAAGIECIDVIEALNLPYHLGNTVKYIFRAKSKGTYLQDLEKARWYLDRYITLLEDAE